MTRMNRAAFEKLIEENLEWLLKQPRTLERDHIEHILKDAPSAYYGCRDCGGSQEVGLADGSAPCPRCCTTFGRGGLPLHDSSEGAKTK